MQKTPSVETKRCLGRKSTNRRRQTSRRLDAQRLDCMCVLRPPQLAASYFLPWPRRARPAATLFVPGQPGLPHKIEAGRRPSPSPAPASGREVTQAVSLRLASILFNCRNVTQVICYRVARLSRRVGIRRGSAPRLYSPTTSFGSVQTSGMGQGQFLRSQRHGGLNDATGSEVPRRSLAPNFRAERSGKFRDGTPGTALGVASVRQDPKCSRSRRAFVFFFSYLILVSASETNFSASNATERENAASAS